MIVATWSNRCRGYRRLWAHSTYSSALQLESQSTATIDGTTNIDSVATSYEHNRDETELKFQTAKNGRGTNFEQHQPDTRIDSTINTRIKDENSA